MMVPRGSFFQRFLQTPAAKVLLSILAAVIALFVRWLLNPVLGSYVPYITFFPAIAFSAWYCGVVPALLTTVLALLAAQYWFVPPVHSLRLAGPEQLAALLVFLIVSGIIIAITELHRRRERDLRVARGELELQVEQRTVELNAANQSLRDLTSRLLQLQDDERRRIARERHDSVGQMLVALNMNLSALGGDIERLAKTANTVKDSTSLVESLTSEIRTISHLLHPPLLDEAGLASALRWYADSFSRRTGIVLSMDVSPRLVRLSREIETTIFRIVQECLNNIQHHSGSRTAAIWVDTVDEAVTLEVADQGRGIPADRGAGRGVGIPGMRGRVQQLGGQFEITSGSDGTRVKVTLPVAREPA